MESQRAKGLRLSGSLDESLHVESQTQRHVGGWIDEFYHSIGNGSVVLPFPLYDGLAKWLLCKPPHTRFVFPDGPSLQMILKKTCSCSGD